MTVVSQTARLFLLLFTIGFLFPATSAAAQNQIEPLVRFEHLTAADGLASNFVLSSLQDSRGFLWFGTMNGLSRYDGYAFKTYTHEQGNPNSLVNNMVNDIREDADGTLWIATGDGISIFDPDTETFTTLNLDLNISRAARGSRFFTTFVDSRGEYWLGGSQHVGLVRYRPNENVTIQLPVILPNRPIRGDEPFPGGTVHEIVETDDGLLWLAAESQLVKYDPTSDQFQAFPFPIEESRHLSLLVGRDGQLWLGSHGGLYRFDTRSETFQHYEQFIDAEVFHFADDGVLWLSSVGRGLIAFDTRSEAIIHDFRHRIEWDGSIADNAVWTLTVDQFGVFWIGTQQGGISRFDPQHAQFTWYGYMPTEGSTLPHPEVRDVYVQSDAVWWVVSADSLTQLNLDTNVSNQLNIRDSLTGLPNAVFQDDNGTIWLSSGAQLIQIDGETQSATPFPLPPQDGPPTPLSRMMPQIMGFHESDDGSLWVGTFARGLLQIDPKRETSQWMPVVRLSPDQLQGVGDPVRAMAEGSNGTLWIGYEPPVITRFDTADGSTRHFQLNNGTGLTGNFATSDIYEDVTGIVWLATNNGLLRLDPATESVERIESVPSDMVVSIIGDRAGSLWLGTAHGLLR